jgi:hypothetical protein
MQARQSDDFTIRHFTFLRALQDCLSEFGQKPLAALPCKLVERAYATLVETVPAHASEFLSLSVCNARSRLDFEPFRSGMKVFPNFLQPLFTRRQAS